MARKKVKLAWIANDSARRATYNKRKKGLMKKMSELSILCGVSVCAIIYSPYDSKPDVWPSPPDAQRILARFKSLPEIEQSKKMLNQEGFLRQSIAKMKEQLRKQEKDNREYEITQLMYQSLAGQGLHDVGIEDLNDMAWLIEEKMKMILERMELLKRETPKLVAVDDETMNNGEGGGEDKMALAMEALQRQPWFMEGMNPHEYMGCGGDEMMFPYVDGSSWSNAFFP